MPSSSTRLTGINVTMKGNNLFGCSMQDRTTNLILCDAYTISTVSNFIIIMMLIIEKRGIFFVFLFRTTTSKLKE